MVSVSLRGVLVGCVLGWFCGLSSTAAQNSFDEPIETLTTIEVPATTIVREERQISIPKPDASTLLPLPLDDLIAAAAFKTHPASQDPHKIVRDSIADRKGFRKSVRPIKAERPPYPQVARRQGWEGTVLLRLTVNREGIVERVTTQKSSGFPELDKSAVRSVKTWRFAPAKDGEFPIPVTVDLPIRFDLDQPDQR